MLALFALFLIGLILVSFFLFIRSHIKQRVSATLLSGGVVLLSLMILTFLFLDQYIIGVIV